MNRKIHSKLLFFPFETHSKTISGDIGSEFSRRSELNEQGMHVILHPPILIMEKGTNERHNGLLLRRIPKGRTILDHTPDALFEKELDRIYAM